MTRSELISGVALVAALAAAGASAMRPAPRAGADASADLAQVQQLEGRVADLESKLGQSERERKLAERQIGDAMATAIEGRRENAALRSQIEDILGSMGSVPQVARTGVDGAPAEPLVLGTTTPDGKTVTAEMIASANLASPPSPYGRPFAAGPSQDEVATVKAALEKIEEEKNKKQQEERENRRKEQQKRRLDQMAEKLQLTPQQSEQVAALWEDSAARRTTMMEAMRGDGAGGPGMDRDQMREQMDAMRKEDEAKMNAILTAAQQAEYAKMQAEQQNRGGRGGAMGGGFGAGGAGAGGGGAQGGRRGGRGGG